MMTNQVNICTLHTFCLMTEAIFKEKELLKKEAFFVSFFNSRWLLVLPDLSPLSFRIYRLVIERNCSAMQWIFSWISIKFCAKSKYPAIWLNLLLLKPDPCITGTRLVPFFFSRRFLKKWCHVICSGTSSEIEKSSTYQITF